METPCTATGANNQCAYFARRRHVIMTFDAHSANMARREESGKVWIGRVQTTHARKTVYMKELAQVT